MKPTENYDPNPLKNCSFAEVAYINRTAPVDSELWRNAGYRMSSIQRSLHSETNRELNNLTDAK